MKQASAVSTMIAAGVLLLSLNLYANKSSVAITAPDNAAKGSVITVTLAVTHDGNNFMHHTDWVYLKANGKEVARWDFNWRNLPEHGDFTREVKLTVEEPLALEAQSNCNIHGSTGIVTKQVPLR